jgi:hypothetical protein
MAKPKSSFWSGTPGYSSNIPLQSPQQAQLANLLGQSAQGVLSGGLKPNYSGFEPIANQARSQFYQDIVPTLAERFTAMGGGAQSSSAFPAALSSAGSELSQGLAALQSQYGMQNQDQQLRLLQVLLGGAMQPQFENLYTPAQPGFKHMIGQGIGSAAPLLLRALLGGF